MTQSMTKQNRIRPLIVDATDVDKVDDSDDTELVLSGRLDALAMAQLAGLIESDFSTSIPFEERHIENFQIIVKMAAFIKTCLVGGETRAGYKTC